MALQGRAESLLSAGRRNERIVIEEAGAPTTDAHGGEEAAWAELCREWAQVSWGTGLERREAAQTQASVPATFRVLKNARTSAVRPGTHRLRFQDAAWDITSAVPLGTAGIEITAVRAA